MRHIGIVLPWIPTESQYEDAPPHISICSEHIKTSPQCAHVGHTLTWAGLKVSLFRSEPDTVQINATRVTAEKQA